MEDEKNLTFIDRMRALRIAAGLNPDKRPATREEIDRARAVKDESPPGTDEYNMREAKLAEFEDRRPRYVRGSKC